MNEPGNGFPGPSGAYYPPPGGYQSPPPGGYQSPPPGGYQSPPPGGYQSPPPAGRSNLAMVIAAIVVVVLVVGGLGWYLLAHSSSKTSTHKTTSPETSHATQDNAVGTCPDLSSLFSGAPGNPTLSLKRTATPPVSIDLPAGKPSIICAGTLATSTGVTDVAGGKPGSSVVTTFTYPGVSVSSYENQLKAEGWTCSTLRATGCIDPQRRWNVVMVEQNAALVILVAAN